MGKAKDEKKTVPEGFRYRETYLKGPPRHDGCDAFRARHPRMEAGRRAKIFAPFDALRGFRDAVAEEKSAREKEDRRLRRTAAEEIKREEGYRP